jgi:succinoglycan biosynthesis protein ExoV
MKLLYHTGKNFGDALNPYIFNHYLGGLIDDNDDVVLLGIGSILGLRKLKEHQKCIVFSSGFAEGMPSTYGTKPDINSQYEVICVRGPLTAKSLGIDEHKAVADGAILLADIPLFNAKEEKKFACSFMPHIGSEKFYNYKDLCVANGIHYISPQDDVEQVVKQIKQSECIITEAMHGAIVADTFRVPWCPVKFYDTINEFKWHDWMLSLNIKPVPFIYIKGLFNHNIFREIFKNKFKNRFLNLLIPSSFYC